MKKFTTAIAATLAMILVSPTAVFAHVVVTPKRVNVGQQKLFNVSVPNERQSEVTAIKLIVPGGIDEVVPTIVSGWSIATTSDNGAVATITWTGKIPVGQRADFTFKAQAPGKSTKLDWKAYQTYADGTVVSWDQKPGSQDKTSSGPYSVTAVVNDLKNPAKAHRGTDKNDKLALAFSIAALAISVGGLLIRKSGPRGKGDA